MNPDRFTLQTIWPRGDAAYERGHPLPDYGRRAVGAILACRMTLWGGHVQACAEGQVERIWYKSCRPRRCPPCAWVQIERWLAKQKGRLLAGEHDHVVFTIPHELQALWLANVEGMSGRLCARVHDTRVALLGERQYRGAKPGIIATLQTWSQPLILHPQLHWLVSGGALSETGQWVAVSHGFPLLMRVVMAFFRGKLLAAIR